MADRIVMEVSRFRPETDSEPVFEAYEVPLTREWAILDGLNYIKDQLDGTLSYRWSCRMGICGSCGMTINGEPKLACAAFLSGGGSGQDQAGPRLRLVARRLDHDVLVQGLDGEVDALRVLHSGSVPRRAPAPRAGTPSGRGSRAR